MLTELCRSCHLLSSFNGLLDIHDAVRVRVRTPGRFRDSGTQRLDRIGLNIRSSPTAIQATYQELDATETPVARYGASDQDKRTSTHYSYPTVSNSMGIFECFVRFHRGCSAVAICCRDHVRDWHAAPRAIYL
jgi:hypothetical protein